MEGGGDGGEGGGDDGGVEGGYEDADGEDTERGVKEVEDLEGPSFEATRAFLSMNFLYSYFAAIVKPLTRSSDWRSSWTHIECIAPSRYPVRRLPNWVEVGSEFHWG